MTDETCDIHLAELKRFDPDLAAEVVGILSAGRHEPSPSALETLVRGTMSGIEQELSMGYAICRGGARVLADGGEHLLTSYLSAVRETSRGGPTLARAVAESLAPMILAGSDRLVRQYHDAMDAMTAKGTYPLKNTLAVLRALMAQNDIESAGEYLQILTSLFSADLSYNATVRLVYTIPNAVEAFPLPGRTWQTRALRILVERSPDLAGPFLEGMQAGLHGLDAAALECFVSDALALERQSRERGVRYLSLASRKGLQACRRLRRSVSLAEMTPRLNRYLQARTGQGLSVRPATQLPGGVVRIENGPWAAAGDGGVFVAPEIDRFPDRAGNADLYRILVGLEAGCHEFATFAFDLEKLDDRHHGRDAATGEIPPGGPALTDLQRFFTRFPDPALAEDLFSVFEHARIAFLTRMRYPGLYEESTAVLRLEAEERILGSGGGLHPLLLLYLQMVVGIPRTAMPVLSPPWASLTDATATAAAADIESRPTVETAALWVLRTVSDVEAMFRDHPGEVRTDWGAWRAPFGRRVYPHLQAPWSRSREQKVAAVRRWLNQRGIRVYRSDVHRVLQKIGDAASGRELLAGLQAASAIEAGPMTLFPAAGELPDEMIRELEAQFPTRGEAGAEAADDGDPVFWYPEWDAGNGDYLQHHVRVRRRDVSGEPSDFYRRCLRHRAGLLKGIRRAFERMKPEGIQILRNWRDGDDFDYRALVDYAVDRASGRTPSDRIYIKRVKQRRDVAAVLLMDLSRSTANRVAGTTATVLDVEKEAVVLFCEALRVVGDRFAIAGYSGTGHLGVDVFHIKDFDEDIDTRVRERIGALAPQRNTRMGAAIRHAAWMLGGAAAQVRLLILLGDGFPNDVDYKRRYAVEDTRRALSEARAGNIHVHAITVNISPHSGLDDLYGDVHHNVISDVRDLPHKLLRIYGSLTRQ